MKKLPKQKTTHEDVPPLRIYREAAADDHQDDDHEDDGDFNPDDSPPFLGGEKFWAGRSLAMRRSARVAA
jgi:hypothetical protein